jgi:ankyrin repeat protein
MTTDNTLLTESELWNKTTVALDRGDFTALLEMLTAANVSVIDLLDANGQPQKYMEEALTWACFVGFTDVARELLDRGVDPTAGIATGMSALHWAVNRGNLETVKLLIERGAPLEQKNMYDGTVLSCALWSAVDEPNPDHGAIVQALVDAGAEIEEGSLKWWIEQDVPSTETKELIAAALSAELESGKNDE